MAKYIKNNLKKIQKTRFTVQLLFALLCIWIGIEMYFFIGSLESSALEPAVNRPPGVEGFLPISALMSIYYFLTTGTIHSYHPAGFFILSAIILLSLVYAKSFCSWLCPVGLLSELVGDFGQKLFKKKINLPKWLDIPLRSLKYLLLAFFVYSIFFLMTVEAIGLFLDTPYNLMADIKMYYFFADISRFSLIVIGSLFVLSVVVRNFWCRYLCPYGALLGIIGLISPNKITRNESSCIDCGLCNKACPSNIKVDKLKVVYSDECTSCLACVDSCPVKDTLSLQNRITKKDNKKPTLAFGIILLFVAVTGIGMASGNWDNSIKYEVYKENFKNVKNLGHPTGTREIKDLNKQAEQNSLK
ncbi:MAG: 4Fe-4S binding protein [Ignavibacteriales bacterium]|jgi:polyferredoxin|nr:4Fe-4S binding protein [Ignavibacteriaceae bacterium]NLH61845.1 4Fe-4S binding protein [Ignavibacteriales bacterium]HOJ17950.1 4Fe-4S binding protein [Ignavibacteriaceae bacterium]HPO54943.1 4Fe-4S binding protein [Ignavibacteriaceae bacterium]